jgi:mannosylglycerate hydrolase
MEKPNGDIAADLVARDFELHVICNSHLDREWTEGFQFTRALTVRFIDRLLGIMADTPEYQFLLDSQTVPLEDYLAVRPEREAELRGLVAARRLWVGPWYTAPDCSCIFGESIVRNLLIGHRVARDFGHVMKEGYTPFGFGQVSQLPQIYAGFGIDSIWFYRGVTERQVPGLVFRWIGADGRAAFCTRAQRYNYYFGVMRPVLKHGRLLDRDYDYASPQTPVCFCDPRRVREHGVLANSQTVNDLDLVADCVTRLVAGATAEFPGSVMALMNGMDTSMPSPMDDAVIRRAQAELPAGWRIFHSNLPDFLAALRREIAEKQLSLPTVAGERRDAGFPHREGGILGDIITARGVLKRRNATAEVGLQRLAEPLAALAWMLGEEYPTGMLDLAWKELCKCHAHDTIAGSGIDQLERDTLNRLDQVAGISETLLQFHLGDVLKRIDLGDFAEDEIPLVVFNPSPRARSEVLAAHVDIPKGFEFDGLELIDGATGTPVEAYTTSWRTGGERVIRDLQDAPTSFYCTRAEIDFVARDVPPLGYRVFRIRKAERQGWHRTLLTGPAAMGNANLRVAVQPDGTLELHDRHTGKTYGGLHVFRDRGEAGDAWTSFPPMQDRVVTSQGACARISVVHDSPLRACLRVDQVLRIPRGLVANDDHTFTRRSDEEVDLPITSYLTLTRDSRAVDIRTEIDNRGECHTLHVLFPTGLPAETSWSDTAFDVVHRGIDRDDTHSYAQVINPTHPCLRFAGVSAGGAGLAIANVGLRGYEVTDDVRRAIGLTLLRAFEVRMCTVSWRWERRPDQKLSQALGRHELEYALIPHAGDWRGAVAQEAERLNVPMLIVQTGRGSGTLPPRHGFVAVAPDDVELSAVKRAESGEELLVRIYNPTEAALPARVRVAFDVASARLVTLEETPLADGALTIADGAVAFELAAKKIATVAFRPSGRA